MFIHGVRRPRGGGKTPPGASYPFTKGAFYPKYVGIFIDAVNFFHKQIINNFEPNLDNIDKHCPFRQHLFMTIKKLTFELESKNHQPL